MLPQIDSPESQDAIFLSEHLDGIAAILKAHTNHLAKVDEYLGNLILGQTAMMDTLALVMAKVAEFEARAEPLLQRAEKRGRLFGGSSNA